MIATLFGMKSHGAILGSMVFAYTFGGSSGPFLAGLILRTFFENTGYWLMDPADELVSKGHCLANPGQEYIVFLSAPQPFTLKLEGVNQPLKAEWYHPFTGEKVDAGMLSAGTSKLTPPTAWGKTPVALHVGNKP